MKKNLLLFIALLSCSVSFAQLAGGTYTVGIGGTYSTLKAACDAANAGITGKVIFEIVSDITETAPVAISNATTDSIIFMPSADADRTITFDIPVNTSGPAGAFIIGAKGSTWADISPAKLIKIDGYYPGSTTRRLHFVTTATHAGENGIFAIVDDCSGIIIKNSTINLTGTNATAPYAAITLRVYTDAGTVKAATAVTIQNNEITSNQTKLSKCINTWINNQAGTLTPTQVTTATGTKFGSFLVKSNVLRASYSCVHLNYTVSPKIQNNELHIVQNDPATISTAVWGGDGNNFSYPNQPIVELNKFLELKAASTGTGGAVGISGNGGWAVVNNYFTGFDKLNAGTDKIRLIAIHANSKFSLYHNTVLLNKLTNKPALLDDTSGSTYSAVVTQMWTGPIDMYNNIFISDEDVTRSFLMKTTANSGYAGSGNVLYTRYPAGYYSASGPNNSSSGPYSYNATFADHVAKVTTDATSTNKDVTFVNEATGNLDLASPSNIDMDLVKTVQGTAGNDINGTVRPYAKISPNIARKGFAGAFEGTMSSALMISQYYSFATMTTTLGSPVTKSVTGSGVLLTTSPVTISITGADAAMFSVTPASVNVPTAGAPSGIIADTQINITYSGSVAGTHSATLQLSNGITTKTMPLLGITNLGTGIEEIKNDFKIMRTSTGLKVTFEGEKAIELFSVNGSLIERTSAVNEYSRSLNKGIYILKLNGKSAKIVL